jgi:hypothetical protein
VPLGILGEPTKKNSLRKESLNEVRNVVRVSSASSKRAARDCLGDVDSIRDIVNLLYAASQAAHSLVELIDWALRLGAPNEEVLLWHAREGRDGRR